MYLLFLILFYSYSLLFPMNVHLIKATLAMDFTMPSKVAIRVPTLMLRLRNPNRTATATPKLIAATAQHEDDCEVVTVWSGAEIVVVQPTATAATRGRIATCTISATWSAR